MDDAVCCRIALHDIRERNRAIAASRAGLGRARGGGAAQHNQAKSRIQNRPFVRRKGGWEGKMGSEEADVGGREVAGVLYLAVCGKLFRLFPLISFLAHRSLPLYL